MSKITDAVSALTIPVVEAEGCTLWDVEYVKEAGTYYLRVYIDKDGGVSIDDCERISRILDPILDEADPIQNSYVFEVGSAGAERELKRQSDYERFYGHEVEIHLFSPENGSKSYVGVLLEHSDDSVSIQFGQEKLSFPTGNVSKVNLHINF